jgi:hypothetical protein
MDADILFKTCLLLTNMAILPSAIMPIMSRSIEEKILALSTFFLDTAIMSSKVTKKLATKSTNVLSKKAPVKKDVVKKSKKVVSSSDDSSDSSSESSEDEPPKKIKKKDVKKSKKKVVLSSEDSSSEDEEIVVEAIKELPPAPDGLLKIGEGLLAIAQQLAASNERQTKLIDLLTNVMAKLDARDHKNEVVSDLLETIDDAVVRGEVIVIGNGESTPHHFENIGHLRKESGKLASQSNFVKELSINEFGAEESHEDEITA